MNSYFQICHEIQSNPFVMWFTDAIMISLLIWLAHYISVFLTIGSMIMLDLRILGLTGNSQTIAETAAFYSPWMWAGVGMLVFTGTTMFASDSVSFCTSGIFGVNLAVTALAVLSGVFIQKRARAWDQPSDGSPWGAKLAAVVSLLLWLGTIWSAVEVPAITNAH